MDFFTRVNTIYAAFFGSGPPARACVAVDLPQPIRIKLDCIAYAERNPADRRALHVQGLSYWAPANIGPYSQAIVVRDAHYSGPTSQFIHLLRQLNESSYLARLVLYRVV